jgi:glutathione S-transferase
MDRGAALTLYDLDHSPFAARVRIAIAAKGLAVRCVAPPGGVRSDAYRAISPARLVPTLVLEDGAVLGESEAIVEYLEDRFPEPPLRPADLRERARARALARVADIYLAPSLKLLFEATKRPGLAVTAEAGAVAEALSMLDAGLGAGPLAAGEGLSTADCALAPLLFFTERCLPFLPGGFGTRLGAYWDRVQKEKFVQPVLAAMTAAQARRAAARARGEAED